MTNWIVILGYIGSLLAVFSFLAKTVIPLRAFAIGANLLMIAYAAFITPPLYPLLILHLILLPINVYRLRQMQKLTQEVKKASEGDHSMRWLVPYMKKESFRAGDCLFKKGDIADKIFFIQSGQVALPELDFFVKEGDLLGEIGVMSPHNLRTSSALCQTRVEALTIDRKHFLVLYYQNPSFGLYLLQMIIARLNQNYESLKNELQPKMD